MKLSMHRKQPLVVAVDDRPEILAAISEMLRGYYTVIEVQDALSIIDIITRNTPEAFLLDIEMPMFDGYDVVALIRANDKYKKTPVIFLTGVGTEESVVKAFENGANDYIVKPVNKQVLITKLNKHLL